MSTMISSRCDEATLREEIVGLGRRVLHVRTEHDDCISPLTPYFVMKPGPLPLIPDHRPSDPSLGDTIFSRARKHCVVLEPRTGSVWRIARSRCLRNRGTGGKAKLFLLLRNMPISPLNAEQSKELKSVFKLDT